MVHPPPLQRHHLLKVIQAFYMIRPFGFLRWMWLKKPLRIRNASLAADR